VDTLHKGEEEEEDIMIMMMMIVIIIIIIIIILKSIKIADNKISFIFKSFDILISSHM
jgi:hypothetical protein